MRLLCNGCIPCNSTIYTVHYCLAFVVTIDHFTQKKKIPLSAPPQFFRLDGHPGKECNRASIHDNGGNGHRFNSGIFQKFPVEIMDCIVQEVLLSQFRAFSSIAALSVVSRQLRYIALKAYFSHLTLHRLTKAGKTIDIPDSYSWVR